MTETEWPTKPKIFILWPFTEKVCQPLCKRNKALQKQQKEVPVNWQVFSWDRAVVTASVAASLTACSSLCRRVSTHLQRASVSCSPKKTERNWNYLGCGLQACTDTTSNPWWRTVFNEQQAFFFSGYYKKGRSESQINTGKDRALRGKVWKCLFSLFFWMGEGFWRQLAPGKAPQKVWPG